MLNLIKNLETKDLATTSEVYVNKCIASVTKSKPKLMILATRSIYISNSYASNIKEHSSNHLFKQVLKTVRHMMSSC